MKHLNNKALVQIARAGKDSAVPEGNKEHLKSCERCMDRFVDLVLRLTAHEDDYTWDESCLEPVPPSIMRKMQDAAREFIAE